MNVLFLASRLPYPPYRGDRLKAYNILKFASEHHRIHLLSFIEDRSEIQSIDHLRKVCEDVSVIHLSRAESIAQCALGLAKSTPFQVLYYRSLPMHRKIAEILDKRKIDVVHTQLLRMAQYTAHIEKHPKVLELTDAVSLYLSRFAAMTANPLKRWAIELERDRLVRYESIMDRFDRCLVCSEKDRSFLKSNVPSAKIDLLPNVVNLDEFYRQDHVETEPWTLIFSGNLSYPPNEDAAVYLTGEIFPVLKRKFPKLRLLIVGQEPTARVRALTSPDVVVTGFVDDIRKYYLLSTVAVSPVRFGAGVLNKILEPMALAVPVVSTSIGVEGLDLEDRKEIMIADTTEDFIKCVGDLLENPELRSSMAEHGRQVIRDRFAFSNARTVLNRVYDEITEKHRAGPVPAGKL